MKFVCLFCGAQRTRYLGALKFWPKSKCKRLVLPKIDAKLNEKVILMSEDRIWFSNVINILWRMRRITYPHSLFICGRINWLASPVVISEPCSFHTLRNELRNKAMHEIVRLSKRVCRLRKWKTYSSLPHKICMCWQELERNCMLSKYPLIYTVSCWPCILDPMTTRNTDRNLISLALALATKSMANDLFGDLHIKQREENEMRRPNRIKMRFDVMEIWFRLKSGLFRITC